jgi:DNA primase
MTMIDEDTIKEIRRQNDIVDVISEYIPLTPKGKNYFGVCPFHDDHSPSMSVSIEKQIYTCFSCKAQGNVIGFVMDYEHLNYVEALKLLAKRVGINLNIDTSRTEKPNNYKTYYEIYDTALKFYKNNLNTKFGVKAKNYLNKRNLNSDTIAAFDLGLSLNERDVLSKFLLGKYKTQDLITLGLVNSYEDRIYDLYKDRIMFPLKDLDGNTVGFSGRIYLDSDENKYINSKESPIFKKSTLLYNYNNAKDEIRRKKEMIICEGFMDVIRLYTADVKNAVGLMGTGFTKNHLEIIKKQRCSVVLCLDNDDPGIMATLSIGEELEKEHIETSVIVFEGSKDIDEYLSKNEPSSFEKIYNNKVNFIDFKLKNLKRNKNLNDSTELSTYINNAIKTIDNIDDVILRELKIKELCTEYGINEEIVRSKITKKEVIKKEDFKIKSQTPNTNFKFNKYQVSEFRIIYLMLNYSEVVRIYEKQLGHLITEDMKRLANEIVFYKEKQGEFIYADFVSYLMNNPVLYEAYKKVIIYNQQEEYTESELNDYINTIQEGSYKIEVEKLKIKMKETLDINEKTSIAKKIEKMKKEVLKW